MSTALTPEQITSNMITTGRAYVRLVEAADVLLDRQPVWTERLLLRFVRALYSHRLRELVAVLPSDIMGEILAASEKMGLVRGASQNSLKYYVIN
jgi:hypothetical protein